MILVGIGSNLPYNERTSRAIVEIVPEMLAGEGVEVVRRANLYATPPLGPEGQPPYVNSAVSLRFPGTPEALLEVLHRVEAAMGRERRTKWGPRTLDLDLLDFGGRRIGPPAGGGKRLRGRTLVLPHPEIERRAFVLVPLADIAPDWRHPVSHRSLRQLLRALPQGELAGVRRLDV